MANSPLARTGETPPIVGKGHGVGSLGPSDTTDSGSDIIGGPGVGQADEFIPLDTGTTSDPDVGSGQYGTAADDIGDADMSGDSDSGGTGERAAAGKDIATNRDRMPDHIEQVEQSDDVGSGGIPSEEGSGTSGLATDRGSGTTGGRGSKGVDPSIANRPQNG